MRAKVAVGICCATWMACSIAAAQESAGLTSLTDEGCRYETVQDGSVTLSRGPVTIVVAANEKFGPDHRAGYNGLASLTHRSRRDNVFVPAYAGLNFEFIHDGSLRLKEVGFEPRKAVMRLRRVDEYTVELYQPPTPTWKLESCTRFRLLADGVIEMAFECVPHADVFANGYVGLFWASYIHEPESKAVHFRGRRRDEPGAPARWITALSPRHGTQSTHVAADDRRRFARDPDFPPNYMVFSFSDYVYTEPFYYGTSHGMALAYVFDPADGVRFSQSPTGGGAENPAWDWQFFVSKATVGGAYGYVMRAVYTEEADPETIAQRCRKHVRALVARRSKRP